MRDIRSWSLFGGKAPCGERAPNLRRMSPRDEAIGLDGGPRTRDTTGEPSEHGPLDRLVNSRSFPNPPWCLIWKAALSPATMRRTPWVADIGAPLDDVASGAEPFGPCRSSRTGADRRRGFRRLARTAFDAMVAAPRALDGGGGLRAEIDATERSPTANLAGWVVRLMDITPLIAALRGQRAAEGHREKLLKLLSHDMRTPLAAILDHAGAPRPRRLCHPNLKQIIEGAARRALQMVDSNARLIRAQSSDYIFTELNFRPRC